MVSLPLYGKYDSAGGGNCSGISACGGGGAVTAAACGTGADSVLRARAGALLRALATITCPVGALVLRNVSHKLQE